MANKSQNSSYARSYPVIKVFASISSLCLFSCPQHPQYMLVCSRTSVEVQHHVREGGRPHQFTFEIHDLTLAGSKTSIVKPLHSPQVPGIFSATARSPSQSPFHKGVSCISDIVKEGMLTT
jgi:hypothetical protein